MINIITGRKLGDPIHGPDKRFLNLTKGLDRLGYPYVVNSSLRAAPRLWINNVPDLAEYVPRDVFTVFGPSPWNFGWMVPAKARLDNALIILASEKSAKQFVGEGFDRAPVRSWAVGVDADMFAPVRRVGRTGKVLIYSKHRDPGEIPGIVEAISRQHQSASLIMYGHYTEQQMHRALESADLVVWHGVAESQGIALGEVLACDVPVLVCNGWREIDEELARRYRMSPGRYDLENAPYFDERCGVKIDDLADLETALQAMLSRLDEFRPREFACQHLSLEGQARAFVDLWEEWGLTFEGGLKETSRSRLPYQTPWALELRRVGRGVKRRAREHLQPRSRM